LPRRPWKSNPYVGLALLLVIALAGWLTYRIVKRPGETVEYSYVLQCANPECEARGRAFEDSFPAGEKPPFRCRYCGQKTAYFVLRCRACGEVFSSLKSPSKGIPYRCPNPDCGKEAAFPLEPGQELLNELSVPE
jgi:hypothetical protein